MVTTHRRTIAAVLVVVGGLGWWLAIQDPRADRRPDLVVDPVVLDSGSFAAAVEAAGGSASRTPRARIDAALEALAGEGYPVHDTPWSDGGGADRRLERIRALSDLDVGRGLSDTAFSAVVRACAAESPAQREAATAALLEARSAQHAVIALVRNGPGTWTWMIPTYFGIGIGDRPRCSGERTIVAALIGTRQLDQAAAVLDGLAETGDLASIHAHLTFHHAQGTLAVEVARVAASPPQAPRRLVALYLALGNTDRAVEVARSSGDSELLRSVLVARGDWAGAHAVEARQPAALAGGSPTAHAAFLALLARLAGDEPARARHSSVLRAIATPEERLACAALDVADPHEGFTSTGGSPSDPWEARAARSRWAWDRGDYDTALAACDGSTDTDRYQEHRRRLAIYDELGARAAARDQAVRAARVYFTTHPYRWEKFFIENLGFFLAKHPDVLREVLVERIAGRSRSYGRVTIARFLDAWRARELLAWWDVIDPGGSAGQIETQLPRILDCLEGRIGPAGLLEGVRAAIRRRFPFHQLTALCETCIRCGEANPALDLLEAAVPAGQGAADAWASMGELANRAGRFEQAERAYRNAAIARTASREIRCGMIVALFGLGRLDLATADLRYAELMACPDGADPTGAVQSLESIVPAAEARRRWEALERIGTPATEALLDRYVAAQDADALERWAQRAQARLLGALSGGRLLSSASTDAIAILLAMGHCERARGRPQAAAAQASRALDLSPRNIEAHALRAAVDPDRAAARARLAAEHAYYDASLVRYPESRHLHERRAWLCARTRTRLDDGLASAELACALARGDDLALPECLATLAEVHFQRGDRAAAIAACERVTQWSYGIPYARRLLARIRDGSNTTAPPSR